MKLTEKERREERERGGRERERGGERGERECENGMLISLVACTFCCNCLSVEKKVRM